MAATAVAYAPVFQADFVKIDDPKYFTRNERVLAGLSVDSFRWVMTTDVGVHWHPLTVLSLMLDATLFGPGPRGPHVVNLILHLANTLLLFLLLRGLTKREGTGLLVAGLFALHPLHVESVAWVAARKDVLSLFCSLLAWLAYRAYATRPAWWRMGAVVLLFACGLMAKRRSWSCRFSCCSSTYGRSSACSQRGGCG